MSVALLITSPYQVFHYRQIAAHLPAVTAVIEVREQDHGLTEEFVRTHLPQAAVIEVATGRLSSLDGRFDAIVCQTPVLPLEFLERSLVVAQQYSLARPPRRPASGARWPGRPAGRRRRPALRGRA